MHDRFTLFFFDVTLELNIRSVELNKRKCPYHIVKVQKRIFQSFLRFFVSSNIRMGTRTKLMRSRSLQHPSTSDVGIYIYENNGHVTEWSAHLFITVSFTIPVVTLIKSLICLSMMSFLFYLSVASFLFIIV